jgi:prepilin-type processing-associated H-X9-DG protein
MGSKGFVARVAAATRRPAAVGAEAFATRAFAVRTGLSNHAHNLQRKRAKIQCPGTVTGAWEVPDRHSEGSNYVFGDGHAKWLRNQTSYPDGPVNTANRKKAYKATADFFAYNDAERSAWLALSR